MISAGMLRETLVIERRLEVVSADLGDAAVVVWQPYAVVRGYVSQTSYTEGGDITGPSATASYSVIIRWHPALRSGDRLRWENRSNQILSIGSIVERDNRRELELACSTKLEG